MKKLFYLLAVALLSPLAAIDTAAQKTYPKAADDFRLLCYNIRHCNGMDNQIDYERISAVINHLRPDFVCLQEVDSVTTRVNGVDQLTRLAQQTGMKGQFSYSIPHQGGKYGNGFLFRGEPISTRVIPLPGEEPRSAVFVEFADKVFVATHLSLQEENRVKSVDLINEAARSYGKPVIMAGDFNEEDVNGQFFTLMKKDWTIQSSDELTFPTQGGLQGRIDYVITLKGYDLKATQTATVYDLEGADVPMASDHFPVFCDFKR